MIKARPVAGDLALGDALPRGDPAVRLAARPRFRRGRRHPRDETPDRRAQGRRRSAASATRWRASPGTTSSSARAASARSSSWRRRCRLVWGGRDPLLRDPTDARRAAPAGRGPAMCRAPAAAELAAAYRFLRGVEHRLQMVNDRQTHALPRAAGRACPLRGVHGLRRRGGVRRRRCSAISAGCARTTPRCSSRCRIRRRRRRWPTGSTSAASTTAARDGRGAESARLRQHRADRRRRCAAGRPGGCARCAPSGRAS